MTIAEMLLPEFDRFDWKPHEKSTTMGGPSADESPF